MNMGSDDTFGFLKEHPVAKKVQAFEVEPKEKFVWRDGVYTVIDFWDLKTDSDRLIVRRDGASENEYFNPYCLVEKVDAKWEATWHSLDKKKL